MKIGLFIYNAKLNDLVWFYKNGDVIDSVNFKTAEDLRNFGEGDEIVTYGLVDEIGQLRITNVRDLMKEVWFNQDDFLNAMYSHFQMDAATVVKKDILFRKVYKNAIQEVEGGISNFIIGKLDWLDKVWAYCQAIESEPWFKATSLNLEKRFWAGYESHLKFSINGDKLRRAQDKNLEFINVMRGVVEDKTGILNFNINSPVQVVRALQKQDVVLYKPTDGGSFSTSMTVLEGLASTIYEDNQAIKDLIDYKKALEAKKILDGLKIGVNDWVMDMDFSFLQVKHIWDENGEKRDDKILEKMVPQDFIDFGVSHKFYKLYFNSYIAHLFYELGIGEDDLLDIFKGWSSKRIMRYFKECIDEEPFFDFMHSQGLAEARKFWDTLAAKGKPFEERVKQLESQVIWNSIDGRRLMQGMFRENKKEDSGHNYLKHLFQIRQADLIKNYIDRILEQGAEIVWLNNYSMIVRIHHGEGNMFLQKTYEDLLKQFQLNNSTFGVTVERL